MTDDAVFTDLDVPEIWTFHTGTPFVSNVAQTLREALTLAFESSKSGKSPSPIRTPTGDKVIDHEQMHRLWRRLGLRF